MIAAIIQNNIVESVKEMTDEEILLELPHCQQIVDVTNETVQPSAGWLFLGNRFEPPQGVDGKPKMIITRLAFRNRFTLQEKAALYTIAASAQGLPIKIYLDDLSAATFIDLSRQETISGIQTLAAIGVLTNARATEILTTVPTQLEVYKG